MGMMYEIIIILSTSRPTQKAAHVEERAMKAISLFLCFVLSISASAYAKTASFGTGFIITKNGYVITCHHIIERADLITVQIADRIYQAQLILEDPYNDLALVKISGSFKALAFSEERSAKMGDQVFTIGYPNPGMQGISAKFTKGEVSSLTGFRDDLRFYQVSVPIQPGNSGGPLVDMKGNVRGIIVALLNVSTAVKITGAIPQNVNYAIKSSYALALLDTLPAVSEQLLKPNKKEISFDAVVNSIKENTVMVIAYEKGHEGAEAPAEKSTMPEVESVSPEEKRYADSLSLYQAGKHQEAIEGLNDFLKTYPKSKLADNAHFWIGESYMGLKKYYQAILAYQEVITRYPEGNKAPIAMLEQALAFNKIKDTVSSKLLLQKIIKKYPDSNEAKTAEAKLKTLNNTSRRGCICLTPFFGN
jgi:tol-pal system protein YbgF